MSARDHCARLGGASMLAASWGCCLWLRRLTSVPGHEPSLAQALLLLASFALTLVGLLLILNGARMLRSPGPGWRERPIEETDETPDPLARLSLADDRAARVDGLTRRAMRPRPRE